jgi:hypothetical protein
VVSSDAAWRSSSLELARSINTAEGRDLRIVGNIVDVVAKSDE